MILVYHSESMEAMRYGIDINADALLKNLDEGSGYDLVAEVESDDLDDAYRLTNHITRSWTENEGVTAKKEKVRSTSVGDLLIARDGIYVVAPCGFDKVRNFDLEATA